MFAHLSPDCTSSSWRARMCRGLTRTLALVLLAVASFAGARPAYAAASTVNGTTCTLANVIIRRGE